MYGQDWRLMGHYQETKPGHLMLLVMASPGGSSKGACCGLASAAGPPPTVWETQPPFSAETNSMAPSAADQRKLRSVWKLSSWGCQLMLLEFQQKPKLLNLKIYFPYAILQYSPQMAMQLNTWKTSDNPLECYPIRKPTLLDIQRSKS